jgi:hypothetical protein
MNRFQHNPRRVGVLILALAAVFIAGLTARLAVYGNNPSTPTAFDEGKIALAFFLNGTANTKRQ